MTGHRQRNSFRVINPESPEPEPVASGSPKERDGVDAGFPEERIFTLVVLVLTALGLIGGVVASRLIRQPADTVPREALADALRTPPLSLPRPLPDFTLVDCTGRTVSRSDLTGHYLVVNFVFTSCSMSCLAVNQRMAEIQTLVADFPDVHLVSFTVDPRTDTPEVLAAFAKRFGGNTSRWLFLTGDKPALYELLETGFIASSPALATLFPGGFLGTDRIMLVDARGNVCDSFDGLNRDVAKSVFTRIKTLRSTSPIQ